MKKHKKRAEFPALMAEGASERAVLQDQYDFLCDLWHAPAMAGPDVFGNLCFRRKGTSKMIDQFVPLRGEIRIDRPLQRYDRHRFDQFFSPNTYSRPSRKVSCVHITRLGWCDVDEADPFAFDPAPSVVWRTSPGRSQALWLFNRSHTPTQASAFSKALTYRHGGDKGGSAPNKLLRLPGSFNHKPEYDTPFIPLVHFDPRPIAARPLPLKGRRHNWPGSLADVDTNPNGHDRLTVLKKYRKDLHPKVCRLIRDRKAYEPDRSAQVFHIVVGLHEVGATTDEIASVLWDSPYFIDKHGRDIGKLNDEISRVIGKLEGGL